MSKLIPTIGFVISFALAIPFSTLWMKTLKHQLQPLFVNSQPSDNIYHSYGWIVHGFKTICRNTFHLESIQTIILMLAVYLFVHFAVKSFLQFIAESFPTINLTKIIKCLNNIVDSFLLFSTILGTYLFYLHQAFLIIPMFITNYQIDQQLLNNPTDSNNSQLAQQKYSQSLIFLLLQTYLYGRILFSVGYIIGTLVKMEAFRASGVALSLISILVALSYTYGFDIFVYY